MDTTGAGDAFVGSLAFFLTSSLAHDLPEAVKRSCQVATLTVMRKGTQASYPDRSQVTHLLWDLICIARFYAFVVPGFDLFWLKIINWENCIPASPASIYISRIKLSWMSMSNAFLQPPALRGSASPDVLWQVGIDISPFPPRVLIQRGKSARCFLQIAF